MSVAKKVKYADMAKELDALYENRLIDLTTTAKEAYEISLVLKKDLTFDKFQPRYYAWKKRRVTSEEMERNDGNDPPEGKFRFCYMSICSTLPLTCSADVLAGNLAAAEAHVVPNSITVPNVAPTIAPRGIFVSPVAAVPRPPPMFRGSDWRNNPNADRVAIGFVPPNVATVLRNQEGQRIVEVCIWLQSGQNPDNISIFVSDDMKSLKYQVPMDVMMENGYGLHRDVVAGGEAMTPDERAMHVRVHHWNTFIDEMRSTEGLLPKFTSDIVLPVEVCSKKILRKAPKASATGARMLLVDLLVEDSKATTKSNKRGFEWVEDDN